MALKFLSSHGTSGGSSSSVKYFDIRLDNDYVVFRGSEIEAASANLAGSLVLCLTDALSVQTIKLTLSGIVHMSYVSPSTSSMSGRRSGYKEQTFYEKSWVFQETGKGKSETLQSDNYEWPFNVVLDGSLPESVEGLKDAYIIYRLKAEICRKRGKDIVVRKPLRIIRTLGSTALELAHAMSVENVWPNKVEYAISTPRKAVVFGSFLQVDFKLIPLLKGLVVGKVSTQLKEEQELVLDPEWGIVAMNGGIHKEDRVIAYDLYSINPDTDEQIIDEAAEGYQFSRYLELPKSLNKGLQDCNIKGIKVRHKIRFNIQLLNPDGHISELRANLPISLYISPNLPLNADNDLVDQSPQAGRAAVENDQLHSAPPLYGEHTLDQLYSDVDRSGYRTPGNVLSAPGTPYTHSRNISSENLASLDTVTNGNGHVSATALQSRLQDLRISEPAIPVHQQDDAEQPRSGILSRRASQQHGDYFSQRGQSGGRSPQASAEMSGRSSHATSTTVSRSNSNEEQRSSGTQTPYGVATIHFEDLAKVPSYSTAVRTPVSRHSPADGLPTYGAAVHQSGPPLPADPAQVHFRDTTNFSLNGPAQLHRNVIGVSEDERRLARMRMMNGSSI